MEQEYKNAGIIGAGASGCFCAYFLKRCGIQTTVFDKGIPLGSLLPTGGGRCNLAHAQYDFRELAKNYPRGEKFLYSVFSKFSTADTLEVFEEMGIKTYTAPDNRIFPVSNSAKEVREKMLSKLKGVNFVREKVLKITPLENGIKVTTQKAEYLFSHVLVSAGGGSVISGIEKHTIVPFKPSLTGLVTDIKSLGGIVLKDVYSKDFKIYGDMLFTHFGVSGPLIFKISSLKARDELPYKLVFDLYDKDFELQKILNSNSHKEFKNIIAEIFPANFAKYLTGENSYKKAHLIDGKTRDEVLKKIHNFELNITGTDRGGEIVTSGGICTDEINPKTMESKFYKNLYFAGEILDIDGFCGGFNLQNAWSTAYTASQSIAES